MWTLDPHLRRRYVHGMAALSVWYVRTLLEQGHVRSHDLPAALSNRVDLYRLTDLWSGHKHAEAPLANPAWLQLATTLSAWIRDTSLAELPALEQRALTLLEPTLEARLPHDVGPPPHRPFECWTVDLGWPGLADRPGLLGKLRNRTHLLHILRRSSGLAPLPPPDAVLHIMNVLVPASPFDDLPRLAQTLHRLIAHIRLTHPSVRELWCNTWLNEHPRMRDLFPPLWFRNATLSPPGNFRNWWGQFARRDGDFNLRAAEQFRSTGGVFPYRALLCHAPLDLLDQHLCRTFSLLPEVQTVP